MAHEYLVTVFADGPEGGNPAPVVIDAEGWTDDQLQAVARRTGRESVFVLPATNGCDVTLRFWVPQHEMSMCGHATIGAVWLLHALGRVDAERSVTVATASGAVTARVTTDGAEVSQPAGTVTALSPSDTRAVVDVLGLHPDEVDGPVANAITSRTKTLVPVGDPARLDGLIPRWDEVEALCTRLDSTGLYPYALSDPDGPTVDARQFPRSSGYPEDPATGIAAAALAYGLLDRGVVSAAGPALTVRQGRAMGRPSRIGVRFDPDGAGCWVGGSVHLVP